MKNRIKPEKNEQEQEDPKNQKIDKPKKTITISEKDNSVHEFYKNNPPHDELSEIFADDEPQRVKKQKPLISVEIKPDSTDYIAQANAKGSRYVNEQKIIEEAKKIAKQEMKIRSQELEAEKRAKDKELTKLLKKESAKYSTSESQPTIFKPPTRDPNLKTYGSKNKLSTENTPKPGKKEP